MGNTNKATRQNANRKVVSGIKKHLSGSVTLTATVSVDYGVTVSSVEFRVDGAAIATATTAPYSISWNTATVSDGTHSASQTFTFTIQSGTVAAPKIAAIPTQAMQTIGSLTVRVLRLGTTLVDGGWVTSISLTDTFDAGWSSATLTLVPGV